MLDGNSTTEDREMIKWLIGRGLLEKTEAKPVHLDDFDLFGHIVPAHDDTMLTFRATEQGRVLYCAGALLA